MIAIAENDTRRARAASITFRRASREDRVLLLAFYSAFEPKGACLGLPPRKDPERWLEGLASYPNFIALDGARIVGHSVLCADGDAAEIAVFVHQDYRGRSIGKRLLGAMIEEAHRLGLRRVWGTTDLENVPMLRLARSLGFQPSTDPREFFLELPSGSRELHDLPAAT